jgi:tetratricopeptide (TPR) repeat protein
VDSFVAVGFIDDAKEALREAAHRFQDHPAIERKMDELGLGRELVEPEPAIEPEAPPPFEGALGDLGDMDIPAEHEPPQEPDLGADLGSDLGADLGAELGDLFSAQAAVEPPPQDAGSTFLGDPGLEDIFKEFRKGVDKQLDKEDYDTRYNLGIAYKEMGLIDEAIAEFQLAAKDEGRLLECSSMLGICFMEKGMPKLAVKWFEKGLKAEGRSDEEYQGLRYDLALALEASGDGDRALKIYTDLYGENSNFRDVATKLRELKAALG